MEKTEIIKYFRSNLFEAYSAYTAWKVLAYSKSSGIVSKELAEMYTKIQKYHAQFFVITERAFLINFVLLVLHPFDHDSRSYSLFLLDKEKTEAFVQENKEVLDELFRARNKLFAHRDMEVNADTIKDYTIPSIERLDKFFENLIKFYNDLTSELESSRTSFSNAESLKRDIELLFMNLERGETSRLKAIDIEWLWEKNDKKISDLV